MSDKQETNGKIVRGEGGKFAPGTVPPVQITSANARSLAKRRWEKAAQTSRNRVIREAASIDPDVRTIYDATALLLAKQYTTLIDSDKPRMDDTEKMMQLLGVAPRSSDLKGEETTADAPVTAIRDIMLMIYDLAKQAAAEPPIDVTPK